LMGALWRRFMMVMRQRKRTRKGTNKRKMRG
jgi:hypothetical protein